jgi:hypothetical protein
VKSCGHVAPEAMPCRPLRLDPRRCSKLRRASGSPPGNGSALFSRTPPQPYWCEVVGHRVAAGRWKALGDPGRGFYSQSFGQDMDERLEMARCAWRAVIASRLGLWDCDAVVGAMENPFA